MLFVYLDESGDLGFDFENKNPSKYFVVTILITESHKQFKQAVSRTLKRTNKVLKKCSLPELKGSNIKLNQKSYFLKQIDPKYKWELHSVVVDKEKLLRKIGQPESKDRLYNIISKIALEKISFPENIDRVNIWVDRSKGKKEIQIFNHYIITHLELKAPLSTRFDIKHEMSHNEHGLQAVDIFCWGISRKYEHGNNEWYNEFKCKINSETNYSG